MNDQLLNSYYYTPHFSNYVVRGLSCCLLGRGWGKKRGKREEKGKMVFLGPIPRALFPPVCNLQISSEQWWWATGPRQEGLWGPFQPSHAVVMRVSGLQGPFQFNCAVILWVRGLQDPFQSNCTVVLCVYDL